MGWQICYIIDMHCTEYKREFCYYTVRRLIYWPNALYWRHCSSLALHTILCSWGLSGEMCPILESIQRRALIIIVPHLTYEEGCNYLELPLLKDRSKELCASFFNQMTIDDHRLNDMIPEKKSIIYNSLNTQSHYGQLIDKKHSHSMGTFQLPIMIQWLDPTMLNYDGWCK